MHHYIIEAMVKALKPTLKNPEQAKQILERFWSDKMALVWDVQDVHTAANEREVALTNRDPSPSEADIKVTRDLIRAGQLLKIEILDHVIVGSSSSAQTKPYSSLREMGFFT